MASVKITNYLAAWHPKQNQGRIHFRYANGRKGSWSGENPAEFTAICLLLHADNDPYVTEEGWITTGKEEPGD